MPLRTNDHDIELEAALQELVLDLAGDGCVSARLKEGMRAAAVELRARTWQLARRQGGMGEGKHAQSKPT